MYVILGQILFYRLMYTKILCQIFTVYGFIWLVLTPIRPAVTLFLLL